MLFRGCGNAQRCERFRLFIHKRPFNTEQKRHMEPFLYINTLVTPWSPWYILHQYLTAVWRRQKEADDHGRI